MTEPTTTPETVDPMKFTRERLTEIANVWMDFAKVKVQPYVDTAQKWMKERRGQSETSTNAPTS